MCDRIRAKRLTAALAVLLSLPVSQVSAQEMPKPQTDSFEVEPPLLVPANEMNAGTSEAGAQQLEPAVLKKQLEQAKKSASAAKRLVKAGVLAKTEAEQRGLRVVRLESELAKAELVAAQEQVAQQKTRSEAGQVNKPELDAATAALAQATAAAQAAEEAYRQAQVHAAELDLHRQQQLRALGSARKSDVARAEEKLARLQRADQTSP